jgi:threonine synthase
LACPLSGAFVRSHALPGWVTGTDSLALDLGSVRTPKLRYPLYPQTAPYVSPPESAGDIQYPLEVGYDYGRLDVAEFLQEPLPGIARWQELLPPLYPSLSLGEGGTPLVSTPAIKQWTGCEVLVKDESRNPTWSHKDRLNLCTVSAAVAAGAYGVAIASSGNHGASAAAYAARAGLKVVVLCDDQAGFAHEQMMLAYGAAVVTMPREARWPLLQELTGRGGWFLLSNTARTHTGHPFGPEGYKTIAYELFVQLGRRVPVAVAVPTSYAELLFGVWKGFCELQKMGLASHVPAMISAEPEYCAPHALALEQSQAVASVDYGHTVARAIGAVTGGYRGHEALTKSAGAARRVSDASMLEAQSVLARDGLWAEVSSCAGLAALRDMVRGGCAFDGPVVAISTSTGLKGAVPTGQRAPTARSGTWDELAKALRDHFGIAVET